MSDGYRTDAILTGSEPEQIESFLHDNRVEIVSSLDGFTENPPLATGSSGLAVTPHADR